MYSIYVDVDLRCGVVDDRWPVCSGHCRDGCWRGVDRKNIDASLVNLDQGRHLDGEDLVALPSASPEVIKFKMRVHSTFQVIRERH